jgi:hypothetical protein
MELEEQWRSRQVELHALEQSFMEKFNEMTRTMGTQQTFTQQVIKVIYLLDSTFAFHNWIIFSYFLTYAFVQRTYMNKIKHTQVDN